MKGEMKQPAALVVAVLAAFMAAAPARAQSTMGKDNSAAADKKPQSPTHKASGTVTKVDPVGGKVTIAHGPVQSLKWPAMTMTFGVGDKALLESVQPGKKVEFEFAQLGTSYVITKIH